MAPGVEMAPVQASASASRRSIPCLDENHCAEPADLPVPAPTVAKQTAQVLKALGSFVSRGPPHERRSLPRESGIQGQRCKWLAIRRSAVFVRDATNPCNIRPTYQLKRACKIDAIQPKVHTEDTVWTWPEVQSQNASRSKHS